MTFLNETHDPQLQSWVASANATGTDFPIQNLPFAVFRRQGSTEAFRGGVAIGDQILDLAAVAKSGLLKGEAAAAAQAGAQDKLNALMALGAASWSALRLALSRALREGENLTNQVDQAALQGCLVPQAEAEYDVPARIGDYTDFYTSIHHATNIGKQFRPDNALLPNYKWVPIGYHGRASSIGVSGQQFRRPVGQTMPPGATEPVFGPCKRLDIELELGIFIGSGNALGEALDITEAEDHVFGICLLNDWSARDIQGWEYQPLGPFLAKNFATTISPWVVTLEALAPYRVPFTRPEGDPQPLPYLDSAANRSGGAFDIQLQVGLQTPKMREAGQADASICRTSYRHAYWTLAQMVTHHTVNGCNLQPGDLLGSGTLSGPTLNQAGALIELTTGGKNPIALPNGEQRTWLEDGDSVVLRGWCERAGAARIGFGECVGTVLPARTTSAMAPTGNLRAVINLGNPILARKDTHGALVGVSVDLAQALAAQLKLPLTLIPVDSAGRSVELVTQEKADVGFFAIDPVRGQGIAFTSAYVQIEGSYLVREDSPLQINDEVDRAAHRVVVGKGSAYDLFLTRELQQAQLVRAPTSPEVVSFFMASTCDVAAGVKQQLEFDARSTPGVRLLPGRFMVIDQAMGLPKNRPASAHDVLSRFVTDMKASGFVAAALKRHQIEGAAVAP